MAFRMNNNSKKLVRILPNGLVPRILCEVCSKQHNGAYGSGRFCSIKCSRTIGGKGRKYSNNNSNSNSDYREKRKQHTTNNMTTTAISQMDFSVDNPFSWKSESIVLHKLKNTSPNVLAKRRSSPYWYPPYIIMYCTYRREIKGIHTGLFQIL